MPGLASRRRASSWTKAARQEEIKAFDRERLGRFLAAVLAEVPRLDALFLSLLVPAGSLGWNGASVVALPRRVGGAGQSAAQRQLSAAFCSKAPNSSPQCALLLAAVVSERHCGQCIDEGGTTVHERFLLTALRGLGVMAALSTPARADSATHQSVDGVGRVRALFDLSTQAGGPFPSDWFTVPDEGNNTNLRINLPYPDCTVRVSDCQDLDLLNTLDGFNLQPRLSIPFDGPIDVGSVNRETVFLISLGSTLDHPGCPPGTVIGIDQVVWDPSTNTVHVESDDLLAQHARYALIITNGLRDATGRPVEASEAFRRFRQRVRGPYKGALLKAIQAARRLGLREDDIVAASVFTTQSTTAVLEKIRDQAAMPLTMDFNLGPQGSRTVFEVADLRSLTWHQQTRHSPDQFSHVALDAELGALRLIPGAAGRIAYGRFRSPEYLVHPGEFIPPVATRTGVPQVTGTADVYFNLVLPSGDTPAGGWPVAIYGTGQEGSKDTWLLRVAASNAAHGIATLSINYYGRGFGPQSTITVERNAGGPVTFPAGGRSVDQLGNGDFGGGFGGLRALHPMIGIRDAIRQTVVDWMQLVRVIGAGLDVDEDGVADLDPARIYYMGNSMGGQLGAVFLAVEPRVRAGVINACAGPQSTNARLSTARALLWGPFLAERQPSLINGPGVTSLAGLAVAGPHFNESLPLRGGAPLPVRLADGTNAVIQSPVINTVEGALAIQEVIDRREWISLSGDPVAYVPHLRNPLAGVPVKSVIIQFAKGDRNQTNPFTTALLRAGDLADRATLFRHDLFFAENPGVDGNPHQFLIRVTGHPMERQIALAYQEQIATFLESDGGLIIQPEPARFFEVPMVPPAPEGLGFVF